jgi:hypothetical protein
VRPPTDRTEGGRVVVHLLSATVTVVVAAVVAAIAHDVLTALSLSPTGSVGDGPSVASLALEGLAGVPRGLVDLAAAVIDVARPSPGGLG